jgi:hypothetical protein
MLSVLQIRDNGVWSYREIRRVWSDRVIVTLLAMVMVVLVAAVAVGAGAFNQ